MTQCWIAFSDRLPTVNDANRQGEVELAESNGSRRRGIWNWIPSNRSDAVALWKANGFVAWRRVSAAPSSPAAKGSNESPVDKGTAK